MRAVILFALGGCAAVLGGLDEGAARESDSGAAPDAATRSADAACEHPWLAGYMHRTAFGVVTHISATLSDYTLSVSLDTRSLIALGRLRSDGRDLRITADDGVTSLRFAFAGPVDSEAAKIWIHLDVPGGTSHLYAYYGGPEGVLLSVDDVFPSGIVPNPHFEPDGGGWAAQGSDATRFVLSDGGGYVAVDSKAGISLVGLCTPMTLPEGHDWEVLFDLTPSSRPDRTRYIVYRGGVYQSLFTSEERVAQRDLTAGDQPLERGNTQVCFGVQIDPDAEPGLVAGTFANVRVRPRSLHAPIVAIVGNEDFPCNR